MDINKYLPLCHKIAGKFNHKYHQDLVNELYIKLFEIQSTYDKDKGSFETYAYLPLIRHSIKWLKDNRLNSMSIDIPVCEDNEVLTIADTLESPQNLSNELTNNDLLSSRDLNDVEKFIQKKYYWRGMSVNKILEKYRFFHGFKDVHAIYRILKK